MSEMTRRDFGGSLVFGAGVAAAGAAPSLAKEKGRPNFVFICSDQHGAPYAGFAGHRIVKTPHLDRIARRGVVFTDTYCGHPVCVPGRTTLMTGRYASDCNSFCNSTVWDGRHPTWGTLLKNSGYYCQATGKMDLDDRLDTGFEEVETGHGHRTHPDITSLFRRPNGFRVGERGMINGEVRDDEHHDTHPLAHALRFLRQDAGRMEKPWALFVGFLNPHPPFKARRKTFEDYLAGDIDMPNLPEGHLEGLHPVMAQLRAFKQLAVPIPAERVRRARAAYYALVSELDEMIGEIWNTLEQSGLLENTIFVYTSDHGEMLGDHGLWLKNNLYDGAAKVPLFMSGPGLPAGVIIRQPVSHTDLVSTMLDFGDAPTPPGLPGRSLRGLIGGSEGAAPRFVFAECHSEGNCTGSFLVRKGDWKFIHFTWYGEDLLFNLKDDPGELRNRANDPAAREVREELHGLLTQAVDPEEVTLRAFRKQEEMLRGLSQTMTENQLFELLRGRLGVGQARALAKKLTGDRATRAFS